ncbi:MAG: ACP S-malonyltransferase, partial [Hymenobacter sp.]
MARELFDQSEAARALLTQANDILGFSLTATMFSGTEADLRRTDVTQPAVFVHSVAQFVAQPDLQPAMVAGHSLGEFSALVAAGVLTFADALPLVARRAQAMQMACDEEPGTMAAILGLADEVVERICQEITAAGHI